MTFRFVVATVRQCMCLLAVAATVGSAQPAPRETAPPELVRTIMALDSAAFAAYNTCDLKSFAAFWSDDVEFYHDQGGLMVGRDNVVNATRDNICGKTTRQLVPGSVTVYVMKSFGAIQMGAHRFFRAGEESKGPVGEAQFVHLWKLDGEQWKVTRVLSFDHHAIQP